jgi:hypothetical protein
LGATVSNVLDFATNYIKRGWAPIPVPSGHKGPTIAGWNDLRLTPETIGDHFNGTPTNIGILTGEPSGWLIDVDLDTPEAVELAPQFLPDTMRFGRQSRPASHWLYVCRDIQAKAFQLPPLNEGDKPRTVCEIRSTRQQTVFPPSTHPSGERVRWEQGPTKPAELTPDELRTAVLRLATASALRMPDADTLQPAIDSWTKPPPVVEPRKPNADVDEAVSRYNADHASDWPKNGGECPMCGHKDCFGQMADTKGRWACFSASHTTPGIRGRGCYHGDALDVDAFKAGVSRVDHLRSAGYLQAAPAPRQPPGAPKHQGRPVIKYCNGYGHEAIDATMPILAGSGRVFKRSQRLVHITDWKQPDASKITREEGSAVIADISSGKLWEIMSREIQWTRYDARAKEDVNCDPPGKVVSSMHDLGEWPAIPSLRGLVTIPILREDGSLCCTPGHDVQSGLYYAPTTPPPEIKEKPTQVDSTVAAAQLLEVINDFPFVENSHRSAWLATVLSRVGWGAFQGGAPLTVFDATTPGTGKTLAADMSALISTGSVAAHSPYVAEDDELRKRITSHLKAGDQVVMIDNVPAGGVVGWACLDNVLTSETWKDRELGTNTVTSLPVDAIFMVTGNNLEVGADAARRTLRCRLESDEERPEERTGFAHPLLADWVKSNRTRLLGCAFTILRGYIVAGRPGMSLLPIGSFDGWSNLVRAAIVWSGLPDPCGARVDKDDEVDQAADAHSAILTNWSKLLDADGGGLTCSQVLGQCLASREVFEPMIGAFVALCLAKTADMLTPTGVGKALRKLDGRVRRGLRLRRRRIDGLTRWRVEEAKKGGEGGKVGSLPPTRASCQTDHSNGGKQAPFPPSTPLSEVKVSDDGGLMIQHDDDDEVPF